MGTAVGHVQFGGINMAGFDFGCGIDGTCNLTDTLDIVTDGTAIQQMNHFVQQDGLNAFRLPVAWQYLVNNVLGGTLDATNFANYNALVQGCLNSGAALCVIDIHNYARWNGDIIAQTPGGPTNAQFDSLWSQLATQYGNDTRIAFGLMNEPHDLLSITAWANTTQTAVSAIRMTGAQNMILLPGSNFTSAESIDTIYGGGPSLLQVTNPDGSADGLVLDVHKYLDSDNSGTQTECVTNNINSSFAPLASFLRQAGRQALLTETGGGNTASCETYLCQELAFLNQNSDVYLGYITWAAGGFDQTYNLTETPIFNANGTVTDQPLVTQCVVPNFAGNGTT
jgi:endoglucanase